MRVRETENEYVVQLDHEGVVDLHFGLQILLISCRWRWGLFASLSPEDQRVNQVDWEFAVTHHVNTHALLVMIHELLNRLSESSVNIGVQYFASHRLIRYKIAERHSELQLSF